jgi:DNA-binding response OmpR family regulator
MRRNNLMDPTREPRAATDPQAGPVRALVVEDTQEFRDLIQDQLVQQGFLVSTVATGLAAVERVRSFEPDVIVLDLGLPDIDGVEVCRQIREFSAAYVVMLTGRDEEVDKLARLSAGADDYVTKPFSSRELVARIRAMLRRPRGATDGAASSTVRRIGILLIDPQTREVQVDGRDVELTRIEFDLLDALTERPRIVFTRARLLCRIWGEAWQGDEHLVDVHISSLRKKLSDDPQKSRFIRTVRGVGYRFEGS